MLPNHAKDRWRGEKTDEPHGRDSGELQLRPGKVTRQAEEDRHDVGDAGTGDDAASSTHAVAGATRQGGTLRMSSKHYSRTAN